MVGGMAIPFIYTGSASAGTNILYYEFDQKPVKLKVLDVGIDPNTDGELVVVKAELISCRNNPTSSIIIGSEWGVNHVVLYLPDIEVKAPMALRVTMYSVTVGKKIWIYALTERGEGEGIKIV